MSRYDKYDPMVGGFRAPLLANWAYTASVPDKTHADLNKIFAVGIDAAGKVSKLGSGATATFVGIMVLTLPKAAGEIVDIMTAGELVEVADAEIAGAATGPGLPVFTDPAVATGVTTTSFVANGLYVGRFVEAGRLVVRCMMRNGL
jgi:hypothetical protein